MTGWLLFQFVDRALHDLIVWALLGRVTLAATISSLSLGRMWGTRSDNEMWRDLHVPQDGAPRAERVSRFLVGMGTPRALDQTTAHIVLPHGELTPTPHEGKSPQKAKLQKAAWHTTRKNTSGIPPQKTAAWSQPGRNIRNIPNNHTTILSFTITQKSSGVLVIYNGLCDLNLLLYPPHISWHLALLSMKSPS